MTTSPLVSYDFLPDYEKIDAKASKEAFDWLEKTVFSELEKLELNTSISGEDLVRKMDELTELIDLVWHPLTHLNGVRNEPWLREVLEELNPRGVTLNLKLLQSTKIYERLVDFRDSKDFESLSMKMKRSVELKIRDRKLAGVGLSGEKLAKFNEISSKLMSLGTKFSNNLMDETNAWQHVIEDKSGMAGFSDAQLAMFSQNHTRLNGEKSSPEVGPWTITLDGPSYMAVVESSRDRDLREKVYLAYLNRATEGEKSNIPLTKEILSLRRELSSLLGYKNYVELSLDSKMANSVEEIRDLFGLLREPAKKQALQEYEAIKEFAAELEGKAVDIEPWDLSFYAKRFEEKKYGIEESELKKYFEYEHVLSGLFKLTEKLFSLKIKAEVPPVKPWDPSVKYYEILSASGEKVAGFLVDPFSRPENKRGGAWMFSAQHRVKLPDGTDKIPVAYLTCNFTPPSESSPSTLSFRDVETLFHEFGHGLQHMLTDIDLYSVSGIQGVEWDAVEVASQFMENWCYHVPTLVSLTKHVETGEQISQDLVGKILARRTFRSGHHILRQATFAESDLLAHLDENPSASVALDYFEAADKKYGYLETHHPDQGKFMYGFGHIFAGGYASGYYSYMWADVLAADCFSSFEEVGLENEKEIFELGQKYKSTILGLGGAVAPGEVFEKFKGRNPKPDALMRNYGLL